MDGTHETRKIDPKRVKCVGLCGECSHKGAEPEQRCTPCGDCSENHKSHDPGVTDALSGGLSKDLINTHGWLGWERRVYKKRV